MHAHRQRALCQPQERILQGGSGERRTCEGRGRCLARGTGHPSATSFEHRVPTRQTDLRQQTLAGHEIHLRR